MELDYKIIGQRVKEIRMNRKLSQANLAEIIDMSVQYISHIETARKHVSLDTLYKISLALNVNIDYILTVNQSYECIEYVSEISQLLYNCTCYERSVIYEIAIATKNSLVKNRILLNNNDKKGLM